MSTTTLEQAKAEFLKPVILAKDKYAKAYALVALEATAFTNPETGKTRCYSKSTIYKWLRELSSDLVEQLEQSTCCESVSEQCVHTDQASEQTTTLNCVDEQESIKEVIGHWIARLIAPVLAHPEDSIERNEQLKRLVGQSVIHPVTRKPTVLTLGRLHYWIWGAECMGMIPKKPLMLTI